MARCRVGDLAVIVKEERVENLGAIVEVMAPADRCECGGEQWHIETRGRPLIAFRWVIPGLVMREVLSTKLVVHDYNLRPLRGDDKEAPADPVVKEKELHHAE